MVDQVYGVGATNGTQAAGNVKRRPTQQEIENNTIFYESLKEKITDYNEKEGFKAIDNATRSADVTDEQINAMVDYIAIMEETKKLPTGQVSRWFNGEAYIPGTELPGSSTAKYLKELMQKKGSINQVLDVDFGNGKVEAPKNSSIKADYKIFKDKVEGNIKNDQNLKDMILLCDFTKEQKQELQTKLTEVATNVDIGPLCAEFGIKVDLNGFKDFDDDATHEDVEKQLEVYNKFLADFPDEVALDKIISDVQRNMTQNLNDVRGVSNTKLRLLQSGKPVGAEVQAEMAQYQKQNIDSYIKLQKAGLLKDLATKVRNQAKLMQSQLDKSDTNLKESIQSMDNGDIKKGSPETGGLKRDENNTQVSAEKAYQKAAKKAGTAENSVGKASSKNKKEEFEGDKKEVSVQRNIGKKDDKYQGRQTVEDQKRDEKIKAEYQIKLNDVKEMLYKKLKEKNETAFDSKTVLEINNVVKEFTDDKAAQFNAVADLIKAGDKSPKEMKAMLQYAKDMDVTGLLPEEIKQLIEEKFDKVGE